MYSTERIQRAPVDNQQIFVESSASHFYVQIVKTFLTPLKVTLEILLNLNPELKSLHLRIARHQTLKNLRHIAVQKWHESCRLCVARHLEEQNTCASNGYN